MIKLWQSWLNRINRLLDVALVMGAYYAAAYLWLGVVRSDAGNVALSIGHAVWPMLVFAVLTVSIYQLLGLYHSLRARPIRWDVGRVLLGNGVSLLIGLAVLYVFRLPEFSRGVALTFYLLCSGLILLKRAAMRFTLSFFRKRGYNQKHVILVGGDSLARQYVATIRKNPGTGFLIDGYIGNAGTMDEVPYLGSWEELETLLANPGLDEVIAALDQSEIAHLPEIIAATEKNGTKVSIIPYFNNYIPSSTTFEVFGDCKLLNVRTTPLDYPANAVMKRAFDVVGALVLIVLTSPLMLFAAIGTKLSSPGPILFRQERVGKNKKLFCMYKFRSMRVNAEEKTGWSGDADPRRTKFGSLLRKTSLDELPQFFNVLKGEMSLVGPRPEVPHYVDQFRKTVPLYMLKHLVRPGITGWAQIHGYRGDTSIEGRIQCDVWYIENWSLTLDIRILFQTAFGGMINKERLQ